MYANCLTADAELNTCFDTSVSRADAWLIQDRFATMPALTAIPGYQPSSEEELYTSFEQAISNRLLAVNKQLDLISGPLVQSQSLSFFVGELLSEADAKTYVKLPAVPVQQNSTKLLPALLADVWQSNLIFACLAIMFILIGFDLMGMLMLYLR